MANKRLKITKENFDPKKHIMEMKCTCRECDKVWHYIPAKLKQLQKQKSLSDFGQIVQACNCNPVGGDIHGKRADDLDSTIKRMTNCPNCQSSNIKKEEIYYEKED